MKENSRGKLLRIFIGETDRADGAPLYEAIVLEARRLGLAGATVTRSLMGFGARSHLHTAKILRLSENLPIVIEIVDTSENIGKIMPFLDEHVRDGLMTMEEVDVIHYQPGDKLE